MLRTICATGLALAMLTSSAMAQGKGGLGSGMGKYEPPPVETPLYNERDYKAASDRIPAAQNSNDPWAGARGPTPDPSTTQAATAAKPGKKKP